MTAREVLLVILAVAALALAGIRQVDLNRAERALKAMKEPRPIAVECQCTWEVNAERASVNYFELPGEGKRGRE